MSVLDEAVAGNNMNERVCIEPTSAFCVERVSVKLWSLASSSSCLKRTDPALRDLFSSLRSVQRLAAFCMPMNMVVIPRMSGSHP